MNSVYVEYSFEKEASLKAKLFRNLLIALAVIFGFYSLFVPILIPVMFMWIALAYYFNRSLSMEYEYIMLDDSLHIDKIIHKEKRKKFGRYDLAHLIDVGKPNEEFICKYEHIKYKTKKYYSRINDDQIYALMLNQGGIYTCLLIQADKEFLDALRLRHQHCMNV